MDSREAILTQLDSLLPRGDQLAATFKWRSILQPRLRSYAEESDLREFVTAASAAIERVAGRESPFYRQTVIEPTRLIGASPEVVMSVVGSLRALRQAVDKGYLVTVRQLARSEVLDDFLAQSRALFDAQYHIPAMVLIGGVLEEHLRKLCEIRGLAPGKPSLSSYNDALKGNILELPRWRRVQSIGDLRNLAAHGKGEQVRAPDVESAWSFVTNLLVDLPQ